MAWYSTLTNIFSGAVDIIKEPVKGWQERKTIKAKSQVDIAKLNAQAGVEKAKAIVEMAKTGQKIEADWDAKAQEQAKFSWKDEALMLLLFSPVFFLFLSAFLPAEYQAKIIGAVNALNEFPTWYVVMLLGIVASVFGLRWLIGPLVRKMTNK
ncbi:MAG: hypothetical protein GY710_23975 [Desulfobacteraceae bacterium]|nr:hypothetical protein [Desulfobacteraceae bacterium]